MTHYDGTEIGWRYYPHEEPIFNGYSQTYYDPNYRVSWVWPVFDGDPGLPPDILTLTKEDDIDDCVGPGETITYTICYDLLEDPNVMATHTVICDAIPEEVTYVSDTCGLEVWDPNLPHLICCSIGTLWPGSGEGCIELVVEVRPDTPEGTVINNLAIIWCDEDPAGSIAEEETEVCLNMPPIADAGSDQSVEQQTLAGAAKLDWWCRPTGGGGP